MSGWRHFRLIAPALCLALVAGCGAEPDRGSTLRSGDREANPGAPSERGTHPSVPSTGALPPATPATLAEYVTARARASAGTAYTPPTETASEALRELDYDGYRSIRFRPEAAVWRGRSAFEVQLLHPGFLYGKPVRIHLVETESIVDLPFDTRSFSYDGPSAHLEGAVPDGAGYSGFRVHYPLNTSGVPDEVVVFQGASYFRLVGPGQVHGLSARGLGIDIGGAEEFPDFTEFWLVRPEAGASTLVFHALLDSPSVAGAYRFELEPGSATVLRVDARLFARTDAPRIGVAPLSTMFLYGANGDGSFDDYRPEVHDSDGLLMRTRVDEWIWRPLSNRERPSLTALLDADPQGFGLVQRARDFDRYLDLEALYHRRPSAWVRIEGDWGPGSVQLFETPSRSEFNDNIAASWVPEEGFAAGSERRYRYEILTFDARLDTQTLAQVERTRIGWDALPGEASPPPRNRRRFVVDFAGGPLTELDTTAVVEAVGETSAGEISDLRATPLPSGLGWRASFRLAPNGHRPSDMRLLLELDGERLSETWSYLWDPNAARTP
jgi:glucans biosynthesis protein